MQILPLNIAVSEAELANNPRAERLLSPVVAKLDTRAFKAKTAYVDRASKVFGIAVIGFLTLTVFAMNWLYQPDVELAKQIVLPETIPPLLAPALEVSDMKLRKITINRKNIALVSGQIINRSGNKMMIPQLDIVLRGKDGHEVNSWRYRTQQTSLKAGASLRFNSKFATDVRSGSVVEIGFVSGKER